MTTPPAHAAQTVDVSRAAVEAEIQRRLKVIAAYEECDEACTEPGRKPTFTRLIRRHMRTISMLRALLDAKEKAEQDNARLRQAIERKDAMLSFISTFADITDQQASDISEAIAYTGNDDTGEMT